MSIDNERELVSVVQYDINTGSITTAGTLSIRQVVDLLANSEGWLIGRGSLDEHYVDLATKEIRMRGPFPAVLDGSTLTDMPIPSRLTWQNDSGSGGTVDVTDSTVELDFALPGIYRVTLDAPAYMPKTYEIEVPDEIEAPE
ncbi:hypothetical protein ACUSIJ_07710 [Pseudochelatococcus sp. B33]